jgi:hypothetical protein
MGFKQSRYFDATGSPAAQIHNSPRRERVLFLDGLDEVSAWPTDGADEVFTLFIPESTFKAPDFLDADDDGEPGAAGTRAPS